MEFFCRDLSWMDSPQPAPPFLPQELSLKAQEYAKNKWAHDAAEAYAFNRLFYIIIMLRYISTTAYLCCPTYYNNSPHPHPHPPAPPERGGVSPTFQTFGGCILCCCVSERRRTKRSFTPPSIVDLPCFLRSLWYAGELILNAILPRFQSEPLRFTEESKSKTIENPAQELYYGD